MPRLSLWKPNKTNDYKFMDRTIREQFHVGGTGAIIHKYIGPEDGRVQNDPTQPQYQNEDDFINETSIQDLLLLENRDRKYEQDLYELRGVYNVSDNDFDLTQFGLFLTNDVLYMTFHINEMVEVIGRKLMNGDVIELPHLVEEYALDADTPPVPKFYVVQDGNRGGEGFSATWWPHIWRVKLGPITDSQEFDDIIGDASQNDSIKSMLSTFDKEIDIRDAVVESAAINDPIGGSEPLVDHLFNYIEGDDQNFWNGNVVAQGNSFPSNSNSGDFFIRTDFIPHRLFVFRETRWVRLYDNIDDRTWSDRTFNASTFINNVQTDVNDESEYESRQAITDAILPRADFDDQTGLPDKKPEGAFSSAFNSAFEGGTLYVAPVRTANNRVTFGSFGNGFSSAFNRINSDLPTSEQTVVTLGAFNSSFGSAFNRINSNLPSDSLVIDEPGNFDSAFDTSFDGGNDT